MTMRLRPQVFMCLAQLFLVNLFTGVIVDTFMQKRRSAEEEARDHALPLTSAFAPCCR